MEEYCKIPIDDVKGISLLWQRVFEDSPEFIREYLSKFARQDNYVVERNEDGKIIGMAHAPILTDNRGNTYTYLYAVAVAPEYRGKGIASHLINKVIEEAKTDIVATIPASQSLQKWYADSFGFEYPEFSIKLPQNVGFDLGSGNPDTDIFMIKKLNNKSPYDYETER